MSGLEVSVDVLKTDRTKGEGPFEVDESEILVLCTVKMFRKGSHYSDEMRGGLRGSESRDLGGSNTSLEDSVPESNKLRS